MKYMVLNDHAIPKGGADKVAIEQYEFLKEKYGSQSVDMVTIEELCGGEYDFTIRNSLRNIFNFHAFYRLRQLVNDKKPKIVLLHSWTKQLSPAVLLALKGVRTLVVCHDYFLSCPNGGRYHYQDRQQCQLAGGSFACAVKNCDKKNYLLKIYRLIRYAVQNRIFRWLDPELYVLNDIQNGLLSEKYRTQTVRNTIPVLTIQNEIGQDVVFLGRCDPEKGIDTIFKCDIPREFGLRLYGPSREEVPEKFRDVAYGWTSAAIIQQQAKYFRVCIFPSLWLEVDPLVPWEMIALGVPVVASTDNVFGKYLLTAAPELAYSNVNELNAILQNFRSDDYLFKIRAKLASLLADERSKRASIQERFYLEIAN
ncbi:hypothetical protein OBB00_02405 [Gammaproteobacteria bacterium]|nr:hypothetical protein [Gammaproteobacteria bacterium]